MREKDPFNPYLVKSIPENEFPHTLTYRYGTLECSYLGWTERFGTMEGMKRRYIREFIRGSYASLT